MGYVTWSEEQCREFARVAERIKRFDYLPWAQEITTRVGAANRSPVILDVGAGPGNLSMALAENLPSARFILTDSAAGMEKIAGRKIKGQDRMRFVRCPADNIPIENESVDIAICKHLLTHVENPSGVFSEMFRVLRPKGTFICIDFDSSASMLKALVMFCAVSINFGMERGGKFWNGYRNGIPFDGLKASLEHTGFSQVTGRQKGVNCFVSGEKNP